MTVRSILLAATVVAALVVPAGPASAVSTVVVDADGAATVASCDATTAASRTISDALTKVAPGGAILVCPGTIVEPGQVVIDASVTISAFDPARRPTIRAGADTGVSNDDRGWWLVRPSAELDVRDLILDGSGRRIHQAIRFRGHGSVTDLDIHDIAYNPSGPDYSGFGVVAFGDGPVAVTRTSFRDIGRVGALFFGAPTVGSVFSRNTYVGKGSGSYLDYGVELGSGARVTVSDNLITRARGQAQDAVSAGILMSTAFGAGVGGTVTGNALANNANGVFVDDSSGRGIGPLTINRNAITGSSVLGVAVNGEVTVDATCNWWGAADGPRTSGGSGDGTSAQVATVPFLTSSELDGRCSSTPEVVPDLDAVTAPEGSPVTVTGTYQAGSPATVELSASIGTLTRTGTNRGTWTWTTVAGDGPSGPSPVTITGTNGAVGTGTFQLSTVNVEPTGVFDAPATAFADRPFTVSLRRATDPSAADRAAGLLVAFDCGTGDGFGAYSTATSTECVVDRGGRRTVRATIRDRDGGSREFSSVVEVFSADGDGAPDRSAAGTVSAGGTVSTGEGPATPSDPIVTSVRTPFGGDVAIEEGPPTGSEPPDHDLLVWGARVSAPEASVSSPLTITFRLDADLLPPPIPGTGLADVVPAVGGVPLLPCRDETASPDPCVASRAASGDDLVLVVRSSRGAAFDFAEATTACPEGGVPPVAFTDVATDVHRDDIACAALWGLVSGVTATTYAPAETITRGQVATTIARLLALSGVTLPSDPPDRFTDDDTSVHQLAIEQVAALGIMRGTSETTFSPRDVLTRAQLATILAGTYSALLSDPLPPGPDAFRDDDGSVHEPNIDAVAAAGLAQGVGGGRFDPAGAVRRDQAASFLTRLLSVWYADFRS